MLLSCRTRCSVPNLTYCHASAYSYCEHVDNVWVRCQSIYLSASYCPSINHSIWCLTMCLVQSCTTCEAPNWQWRLTMLHQVVIAVLTIWWRVLIRLLRWKIQAVQSNIESLRMVMSRKLKDTLVLLFGESKPVELCLSSILLHNQLPYLWLRSLKLDIQRSCAIHLQ